MSIDRFSRWITKSGSDDFPKTWTRVALSSYSSAKKKMETNFYGTH